jgi:hypothetical protein
MARLISFYEGKKLIKQIPDTELPVSMHTVFLKNGQETNDPSEADEVVPIEKHIKHSADKDLNYIDHDPEAPNVIINSFGPKDRPLKSEILKKSS